MNFNFNCKFMFQRQIYCTEMINILHYKINVRKSLRHPQCTLQLLCEDRVLLESAFAFLYVGSSIQNANEQFVSCIHLSVANFAPQPTTKTKIKRSFVWVFKQLYLGNNSECDVCSYELVFSESPVLSPHKIFTFLPESHCVGYTF